MRRRQQPTGNLLPTFAEEESLAARGYRHIAGIDEVGCGPLAGPVLAAAVILPYPLNVPWLDRVRDSKQLTPARREQLSACIQKVAISTGVGIAPVEVVDTLGLTMARRLAMKLATDQLSPRPDYILIDYFRLTNVPLPQKAVVNGDSYCFSIACASIVAKVARDRLMVELDKEYPGYGLARHKGYSTKEHLDRLECLGPSPIHRRSFQPVRNLLK